MQLNSLKKEIKAMLNELNHVILVFIELIEMTHFQIAYLRIWNAAKLQFDEF